MIACTASIEVCTFPLMSLSLPIDRNHPVYPSSCAPAASPEVVLVVCLDQYLSTLADLTLFSFSLPPSLLLVLLPF